MRSGNCEIRNKRLLLTSYFLFLIFIIACGRRGDPIAIAPFKEVGVVKDLKASTRDGNIYLSWSILEDKDVPEKALKGFVVFRADVPEGTTLEECGCPYRSLDFITPDGKKTFEYLDEKAVKGQTYAYKLVGMDINNKMSKDSNIVLVKRPKSEPAVIISPKAPTGLIAVYTQQSIVLTWDEIYGQEIKFYRVYRSEGKEFVAIGKSVTSVFTDKNIKPSKKYHYRVTAFGETEGPPSEEIQVFTKIY